METLRDSHSIVFGTGDFWTTSLPACSHHLARAFSRAGWRVGFVSGPITPWHLAPGVARDMGARWRLWRSGGIREKGMDLFAFLPLSLVAPSARRGMRGDWVQRHWWRFAMPGPAGKLRRAGFAQVDVLCFDGPTHAHLLRQIPHRRSVLRIADYLPSFPWHGDARERALRQLAGRVDLVIHPAGQLRDYVRSLGPRRSTLLPNGVDFDLFAAPQPPPSEYATIPAPRAVYAGNIAEWFDFALVDKAAEALPEVSFVLVGPPDLARRRLRRLPNIHLLGTRLHSALPAYLQHASVGMIPFDVVGHGDLVEAVSPLKLFEYLASGLPVVAVNWAELRALRSPAVLCDDTAGFVQALRRATVSRVDLDESRLFAAAHDWGAVAQRLVALLDLDETDQLLPKVRAGRADFREK